MFEFGRFVEKYKKSYANEEEFKKRYVIFNENMAIADAHNKHPNATFSMGVGPFADLTQAEFAASFLGFRADLQASFPRKHNNTHVLTGIRAPTEGVDWRKPTPD